MAVVQVQDGIKYLKEQLSLLMWESRKQERKQNETEKRLMESQKKQDEAGKRLLESQKKHVKAERWLREAEQKFEANEESLMQIKGMLFEAERKLNEKRRKEDKTINEIDQKVRFNTEELRKAKGLQILFKNSLVEKAVAKIDSGDITNIEGQISCLETKVDGIEATCTELSEKQLSRIPVYHSSLCKNVYVDQAQALLINLGECDYGSFMSAKPLTSVFPYFSVEIIDRPSGFKWFRPNLVGLAPMGWDACGGLAPMGWDACGGLGWLKDTVGYIGGFGGICISGTCERKSTVALCNRGDVMKIALTFSPLRIEFFKNRTLNVGTGSLCGMPHQPPFPEAEQVEKHLEDGVKLLDPTFIYRALPEALRSPVIEALEQSGQAMDLAIPEHLRQACHLQLVNIPADAAGPVHFLDIEENDPPGPERMVRPVIIIIGEETVRLPVVENPRLAIQVGLQGAL